jgi:hypothetical protein
MRKPKLIFGLVVLALGLIVGWPIASCEWDNFELHEDLRDIAAQGGARVGLLRPSSDDDLRNEVIREAKEHDIQLEPEQVTVQRSGTAEYQVTYLAADYEARVKLPGFSFPLHFTPTSAK